MPEGHSLSDTVGQYPTRMIYSSRSDATQEGELRALRSAYAYVLARHERKVRVGSAGETQAQGTVNAGDAAGAVT